jgi:hypothetical protein
MSKENQMETAVESTSAAPETSPVTATPAVEASTSPNANALALLPKPQLQFLKSTHQIINTR